MGVVSLLVYLVALFFAACWIYDRFFSDGAYLRAHERATREDIAYYDAHPGCTLEEAHRQRNRVNRRFGK